MRGPAAVPVRALALVLATFPACTGDREDSAPEDPGVATGEPSAWSSPGPADSLYGVAMEWYDASQMDSARAYATLALSRARETTDRPAEARALTRLGFIAWRLGEFPEARRAGEEALRQKLEAGLEDQLFDSYNALGLLAWQSESRYGDALEHFRRAQELAAAVADTESLAKAWNNLGNVHTDLGEFGEARRLFPRALEAARAVGNPLIEGRVLTNLGMLAVRTGEPASAIAYLEEGLVRSREAEDLIGEQAAIAHLGTAYAALGDLGRAIAHFDSAIVEARRLGHRQEEASDLEQLAELYRQTGDYSQALRAFGEARAINRELDLLDEFGADLRSEAQIHATLGNPVLARRSAAEALAIHRAVGARLEILSDLLLSSELAHAAGDTEESTDLLAEARELARTLDARMARAAVTLTEARMADGDGDGTRVLRALRDGADDLRAVGSEAEWEALALAARAWLAVGRLDSAAAAGRRAVAIVEKVRGQIGAGILRTSYAAERADTYRDLVRILLRQGRVEEAFEVADRARGRALLEELATRGLNGDGRDRAPLRLLAEEERQMLRAIETLSLRISDALEAADAEGAAEQRVELDRLYGELDQKRAEYAAVYARSEAKHSGALPLLGGRGASVGELRAALGEDDAVLQYTVLPERVLLFVVRSDTVRMLTSPVEQTALAAQVRIAREVLGRPGAGKDDGRAALEALHGTLLGPAIEAGALEGAATLVIVPDAELTYLPFAALRDARTGRHLAEDHALLHLPSSGALVALRSRPARGAATRPPVAFAPHPEDLPATIGETSAFRSSLGASDAVRGRQATEARFREALSGAPIVHAATHAVLNARSPLFSHLELARSDGAGPGNDGRLEVHELLDVSVAASLVFLSGCETGVGTAWATGFSRGEDYATLARAFLYAGAENVIATLWRVEDEGAAAFAATFYRELSAPSYAEAGSPPAGAGRVYVTDALAEAQRAMMRDARFSAPYYWAGYRLSGTGTLSGWRP